MSGKHDKLLIDIFSQFMKVKPQRLEEKETRKSDRARAGRNLNIAAIQVDYPHEYLNSVFNDDVACLY